MQALTFTSHSTVYALPIERVVFLDVAASQKELVVRHEANQQRVVIDYQGEPVTKRRFTDLIGAQSEFESRLKLVDEMNRVEKSHTIWKSTLEKSIRTGSSFEKSLDPHECGFGQWFDHFHSDDTQLMSLVHRLDAPHRRMHTLAEQLLTLAETDRELALKQFESEQKSTFGALSKLLDSVRGYMISDIRPVCIIMSNGKDKLALEVDNLGQLIDYTDQQFIPRREREDLPEFIDGYISAKPESKDKSAHILRLSGIL